MLALCREACREGASQRPALPADSPASGRCHSFALRYIRPLSPRPLQQQGRLILKFDHQGLNIDLFHGKDARFYGHVVHLVAVQQQVCSSSVRYTAIRQKIHAAKAAMWVSDHSGAQVDTRCNVAPMSDSGRIVSTMLVDENVVITLIDGTFLILTLNQLLNLGVTRHRIPSDLTQPPKPRDPA